MVITITINGQQLQQVTSFIYLGSSHLQKFGDCEMDIRKRLGMKLPLFAYPKWVSQFL